MGATHLDQLAELREQMRVREAEMDHVAFEFRSLSFHYTKARNLIEAVKEVAARGCQIEGDPSAACANIYLMMRKDGF